MTLVELACLLATGTTVRLLPDGSVELKPPPLRRIKAVDYIREHEVHRVLKSG